MKNIQSWKHDYKNHMVTMTALAKEECYTELLDYLKRLQENLPEYFTSISSGNTAIDAIVTNKLLLARQAGIPFTYSIMLTGICPLSDLDITAILGNLLDNSVEASKKLLKQHHEKRWFLPWLWNQARAGNCQRSKWHYKNLAGTRTL